VPILYIVGATIILIVLSFIQLHDVAGLIIVPPEYPHISSGRNLARQCPTKIDARRSEALSTEPSDKTICRCQNHNYIKSSTNQVCRTCELAVG
jgi:hypothetical protein